MTHKTVKNIFSAALSAVDPYRIIGAHLHRISSEFTQSGCQEIVVVGFGKSSYQMAKALEDSSMRRFITEGIIITKYGHSKPPVPGYGDDLPLSRKSGQDMDFSPLKKIKVYEAGHPVPDVNGTKGTDDIVRLLGTTGSEVMVLCLVSGGGSALLVSPCRGISLREKQRVTELLLKSGAGIHELNAVRKHISGVKGGRLAEIAYPSRTIALILSDVVGDNLDVIASGPVVADTSTYGDAIHVLEKYGVTRNVPLRVLEVLEKGKQGLLPETPKKGNPIFKAVSPVVVGNNQKALDAAKERALSLGWNTEIVSSCISGEARDVGKEMGLRARQAKETLKKKSRPGRLCLVSGGETTETVTGTGKGGRNTELALSFAIEIEGERGITLLSAGTDGTDGPTDAAGAVVNGTTVSKARDKGLNAGRYLGNNDSYSFFQSLDSLLITGPTGTNVMDVQVVCIETA